MSLDPEAGEATLGASAKVNPGGIGKGYALDVACRRLLESGVGDFMMHGGSDPICDTSGSEAFHASLPGANGAAGAPRADLRVYPELRHEIFNEPQRHQVFEDLLRWMLEVERPGTGDP